MFLSDVTASRTSDILITARGYTENSVLSKCWFDQMSKTVYFALHKIMRMHRNTLSRNNNNNNDDGDNDNNNNNNLIIIMMTMVIIVIFQKIIEIIITTIIACNSDC